MVITASRVKELRERTGSGMMECKRALVEANGDIDAAIETMRKSGLAKADKKAGRTAAEGLIVIKRRADGNQVAMAEVNSETDFVSKGDDFKNFVDAVAQTILDNAPADLETLLNTTLSGGGHNVAEATKALIARIGEKVKVRRFAVLETTGNGLLATYQHGERIGVVVELQGGNPELGHDIAMHIAASRPQCISAEQVPAALIEKEKDIFSAQAAESGKPPEIVEKMIAGRVKKFLKEITLLGQPFVKDTEQTIEQLLQRAGATVQRFERLEVGEGIEKKAENFADEVMAQVKG